ncbi:MAG: hypothetical protein ABIJ53_08155 [Verrucomicrobiota bacterium]
MNTSTSVIRGETPASAFTFSNLWKITIGKLNLQEKKQENIIFGMVQIKVTVSGAPSGLPECSGITNYQRIYRRFLLTFSRWGDGIWSLNFSACVPGGMW